MIAALLASAGLGTGQITVSNETAPPGGSAQFKVWPIAPGKATATHLVLDFDPTVVGTVQGIGAFNADGDIYGAATVNGTHVDARLSMGVVQIRELPLLTVTVRLRPDIAPGTRSTVKVATVDNDGATVITEGSLTVGADSWIEDVSPGEGLLPAGAVVTIRGGGFASDTTIEFGAVAISSAQVLGENEIAVILTAPTQIKGKKVHLRRGSAGVDFFCSTNAVSAFPALSPESGIQVMFPPQSLTSAVIFAGSSQSPKWIAVENSNAAPITLDLYGVGEFDERGPTTVTVPAKGIWLQNTLGVVTPRIGMLEVVAPIPVRMAAFSTAFGGTVVDVGLPTPAPPPGPPQFSPSTPLSAFEWQIGSPEPAPQKLSIFFTRGALRPPLQFTTAVATNSGGNWLHATPLSGTICGDGTCPALLSVSVAPSGLIAGMYTGTVTVAVSDPGVQAAVIPISLTVSLLPFITVPPPFILFSVLHDGVAPAAQTVKVDSTGTPAQFTLSAATDTTGNSTGCFESFGALTCDWLIVAPSKGTTPATVTIAVNPAGVSPGHRNARITIAGPSNSQSFPVFVDVYPMPASLDFFIRSGTGPMTQNFLIPVQVSPMQVTATTDSGGNWLAATPIPSSGSVVAVTTNPAGLVLGSYSGTVNVISALGTARVTVTLRIWDTVPQLTLTPGNLDFTEGSGGTEVLRKDVTVTTGDIPQVVTIDSITSASGERFLTAYPTTNATPTDLAVVVNTVGIRPGIYHSTITVKAGDQSAELPVTLTLTAGAVVRPVLGAIVNGASDIQGAVAPGEIVALHGTNLGPLEPTELITENGKVPTTLSGTRALFDGVPAPVLYASLTQLNVVVPRQVAGRPSTLVEIEYFGSKSVAIGIPVAEISPAVFTLDSSGAGPGAVLNQDNTVNAPTNPAARGSVIQIFGTGATGPVSVTIDGVDAPVIYAGPAPLSVDGLLQVNAVVPDSVSPGRAVPLILEANGVTSQLGTTISVR